MKAHTVVGRGEKSLLGDHGSELVTSREGEVKSKSAKIIARMSKKTKCGYEQLGRGRHEAHLLAFPSVPHRVHACSREG